MRNRKKQIEVAKLMFKNSLKNGQVDKAKVRQVLKEKATKRQVGTIALLKKYKRLIEMALAKEEVIFEIGQKITNLARIEDELLSRTQAARIKIKINPKIVFGAKITHGDWQYDATLDAKLKELIRGI